MEDLFETFQIPDPMAQLPLPVIPIGLAGLGEELATKSLGSTAYDKRR
jgi:hypothetical protein